MSSVDVCMPYTCVLWKSFRQMSESSLTPIVFAGEVFSVEPAKIIQFRTGSKISKLRIYSRITPNWHDFVGAIVLMRYFGDVLRNRFASESQSTENSWLNHILHEQNQIWSSNSRNYPLILGWVSVWLSVVGTRTNLLPIFIGSLIAESTQNIRNEVDRRWHRMSGIDWGIINEWVGLLCIILNKNIFLQCNPVFLYLFHATKIIQIVWSLSGWHGL